MTSGQAAKARILVVDDEPAIRDMVGMALTVAGFTCLRAGDSPTALASVHDDRPDLVLLDWMLPGGSGLELARRLRRDGATATLPIIMLTAKAGEDSKVTGLEAGADDYITKPFSPRELVARVTAVLRRARGDPGTAVLRALDLRLDGASQRVAIGNQEVTLRPAEYRLLAFLLANQERVFSRDGIRAAVWGRGSHQESRTVDVHIRRLREALSAADAPIDHARLIQTVRGAGYRLSARWDRRAHPPPVPQRHK